MSIHRTYAVFGLGRYGFAVASELVKCGAEVLAVDSDPAVVEVASTVLPVCKCADVTDPEVVKRLGVANFDVVIVAMAGNLESSVLATMLCKEQGVKTVIVKCAEEMHRKILLRIGADRVVFPESDSGIRLAKNLLSAGFVDLIGLSSNVSVVEMDVPNEWVGKSLMQLNLRKTHALNVIAVKIDGELSLNIDPTVPLIKGNKLIIIADTRKLSKLKK